MRDFGMVDLNNLVNLSVEIRGDVGNRAQECRDAVANLVWGFTSLICIKFYMLVVNY